MNLTRKLFYNKRNGQATLIIPAKTIDKLQKKFKPNSLLKIGSISFKITNAKGGEK